MASAYSLKIFAVPLGAVAYAISAHQPDLLLSVMPKDEIKHPFPNLPLHTRHYWCEVYDCHYAETDLSVSARRRTEAIFKDEYGADAPHLITGLRTWHLLREIDQALENAKSAPQIIVAHCHGGISRSQAAAYILLCKVFGQGREAQAFDALMLMNSYALPNPLLVWQADRLMRRGGAMVSACASLKKYPRTSTPHGLKIDLITKSTSLCDYFV